MGLQDVMIIRVISNGKVTEATVSWFRILMCVIANVPVVVCAFVFSSQILTAQVVSLR